MKMTRTSSRQAFTLIELLVVVTIIGILASLSVVGVQSALKATKATKETAAARSLTSAYLAAASDNNGVLPAGYDTTATASKQDGNAISFPASARYVWRLAPYFSYNFKDVTLPSFAKGEVNESDSYQMSLCPSFGINGYAVGGFVTAPGATPDPNEVATLVSAGANIVVFATARMDGTAKPIPGHHMVTPPKSQAGSWASTYNENLPPASTGNVDFRYNKHAIVGFLDGRVASMSFNDLSDMTLWSKVAADTGNKDYVLTTSSGPAAPSGGGGSR